MPDIGHHVVGSFIQRMVFLKECGSRKPPEGVGPELKESVRWGDGYERVAELARELPETDLVYMGDREADIREWMVRARDLGTPAEGLVRSQHNRTLPDGGRLWGHVLAAPPLGDGQGGHIEVTCLIAREIGTPAGVKPIEWRLLSNRHADTTEAALELIEWYRARWEVELLFLILKEACRVEALQLARMERIERALMPFLVVAWCIARLMPLGRTLSDLDAGLLLEPEEWQAAYILTKNLLPDNPRVSTRCCTSSHALEGSSVARLMGEPGVKTIWFGLQRIILESAVDLALSRPSR